jgi:prolyl-tRNA editing enzyme YbaK/EbsC (Cys-tRNA(Pro) deacylase)
MGADNLVSDNQREGAEMTKDRSPSACRVQEVLDGMGLALRVKEMGQTTRSAQDAAKAVGCEVGQIAKSLVFKGSASELAILVITSGANRVNEAALARMIGEPILKADADFVRAKTGYAIGGVPPVGHPHPLAVFIDEDLLQYPCIWAAAGSPQAVFHLTPQELQRITGGRVICVKNEGQSARQIG